MDKLRRALAGDSNERSEMFESMEWRLIGPHRGGRVGGVAGDPSNPLVFYFGACAGGVWKTTDGGRFWECVSDGYFKTGSVGALAVAPSDPNVIYAGMGESAIRGDVSHGDGVYKSTDGGRHWSHLGLVETRHIAEICIHPDNPDLLYVAAFGHTYGPNSERGVYRTSDGGATWEQILFRDERTGAIDLAMDPTNPRILYAALWEAQRSPYSLSSGGPGSGLFKSDDGGDTWLEITESPGLPAGIKGKIGVAVSPAMPERVWALVEAKDGGLFRSDDAGSTWKRITEDRRIWQRPWYFMHIFADPQDPETVWVLNVACWKSTDGGRSFVQIPVPFEDQHDLWIDPRNPQRMIEGNDGGACVSFNGGITWSSQYNQPTSQFYHVTTDNQIPYRLYGAQQDINVLSVPSRSDNAAITSVDWYPVGGGESGYVAVNPNDPNEVYAGSFGGHITRYDHRTRQAQDISVWPDEPMGWGAKELKYRFQWTFPIVASTHNPDTLYIGGNHVFRSTNKGMSWDVISPDLTRNDPSTMEPSGGPITKDNVSTEYYGTVFALAESPVEPGCMWSGSDDGLIHVSRDGGETWQDVTPPDDLLPEWSLISIIEASPHGGGTAYVAATRYKLDDFTPYVLRTTDYGETWTTITDGVRASDFARVVREDPKRPGLLYLGTETGIYVSFDAGEQWQPLQQNLPVSPIYDLVVKQDDLVVATHGRSFWILDDISPLHQISDEVRSRDAYLFQPKTTYRFKTIHGFSLAPAEGKNSKLIGPIHVTYRQEPTPTGEIRDVFLDAGENPPNGVLVTYYLKDSREEGIELSFLEANGNLITTFSNTGEKTSERRLPSSKGLNRFVWDMRYPSAVGVEGATFWEGGTEGPVAAPGQYHVRLRVGNEVITHSFEILNDPRVPATQEDLVAQFNLLIAIRDKLSQTHQAVNLISDLKTQLDGWDRRMQRVAAPDPVRGLANDLDEALTAVEGELIQRSTDLPYAAPIKLNAKLASLGTVVASADSAPTRQSFEVFADLSARVDAQLARLQEILENDVTAFNEKVNALDVPAITVSSE